MTVPSMFSRLRDLFVSRETRRLKTYGAGCYASDRPRRAGPKAPWTDNEIAALRAAVAAGDSYPVVADRLGRSSQSCRTMACRLGLKRFKA